MPSPKRIKDYVADSFYHIYNRGVGKMVILREKEDYVVFLHYLKLMFSPVEFLEKELEALKEDLSLATAKDRSWNPSQSKLKRLNHAINQAHKLRVFENVQLLSYALMPNHFHLLVYQKSKYGIKELMHRLPTAYSSFFTRKYDHPGTIYEGRYCGSHLYYEPELQALSVARYIERNCLGISQTKIRSWFTPSFQGIENYPFSSFQYYLAKEKKGVDQAPAPVWLNTKRLNDIFYKIKKRPNSVLETRVAHHSSYTDFVLSDEDFSLEDVRLAHLESLF